MNDFLHGMVIRLACASLPVRKVYADVLDNEWPISWTSRSVKNNKTYLDGTMTFRRVSDAVGYDYANAAAAVTMVGDGFTETFTAKHIGVTDTSLGKLIYIRCTLSGTIFILALLVIETPGFEGAVEFDKTGTYYAFLNSSYVNVEINNADVQFELTAPDTEKTLIGYMYNDVGPLPELPEWDKTVYPYVYYTEGFLGIGAGITCISGMEYFDDNGIWKFKYTGSIHYNVSGDAWGEPSESSNSSNCGISAVKWANFDVLNADGSVYLAASEPVPVYE